MEDKFKIATHYMLSAPPGQAKEVEADVKVVLGPPGFDDERAESVYRALNISNMVALKLPADATLLICAEGELSATKYLDSHRKRVYTVNHRAQTVVGEPEEAPAEAFSGPLEPLRAALAQELLGYSQRAYNPGGVGTTPWARGCEAFVSKDGHSIVLLLQATVKNLSNFWSGSWRSRYTLSVSGGKPSLQGTVKITTHYFENGNTQMHDEKAVGPLTVEDPSHGSDPTTLARAVVGAIAQAEDALQDSLSDMYDSMSTSALKEMRRVLPISGQKMNWNVQEHRMRKTLGAGKK